MHEKRKKNIAFFIFFVLIKNETSWVKSKSFKDSRQIFIWWLLNVSYLQFLSRSDELRFISVSIENWRKTI